MHRTPQQKLSRRLSQKHKRGDGGGRNKNALWSLNRRCHSCHASATTVGFVSTLYPMCLYSKHLITKHKQSWQNSLRQHGAARPRGYHFRPIHGTCRLETLGWQRRTVIEQTDTLVRIHALAPYLTLLSSVLGPLLSCTEIQLRLSQAP